MAIEEVTAHKIICDGCKIEFPLYEDRIAAQNAARLCGWVINYGAQMKLTGCWCRNCWRKSNGLT